MKKSVVIMLAFCGLVLAGCGKNKTDAQNNVTVTDNRKKEETTVTDNRKKDSVATEESESLESKPGKTVSDDDFTIKDYLYESDFDVTYDFIIITNNSEVSVSIGINGTARDESGAMIGADDASVDILGPGETTITYLYMDGVKGVKSVDYSFSYNTSLYYYPVIGNIAMDQILNDKNVTVAVTNNGQASAEFVEVYALFFDSENNVISHSSTYATDTDSQLKPSASLSVQLDCYYDYDHAEVYLTGRATEKSSSAQAVSSSVSDVDFSIRELPYSNDFASYYYLIITNNSTKTVAIKANGTAKDADGNVLGADDAEIDVLAPNETSITYLYFDNVKGMVSVECSYSYDENPYYSGVITNLSVEEAINDKNVVVAATNNGDKPAEFVEAYALFMDSDNNIVTTGSTYLTDNDSQIKPGSTVTDQITAYESFNHVEVYLTGRAQKY